MKTVIFFLFQFLAVGVFCQQFNISWAQQSAGETGRVKYLFEDHSHYYFTNQVEENEENVKTYIDKINKNTLAKDKSFPVLQSTSIITEKTVRVIKTGEMLRIFYRKFNSDSRDEMLMCKSFAMDGTPAGDAEIIIGPIKAAQVNWNFITFVAASPDNSRFFAYALYFDKYTDFKTLKYVVLDSTMKVLKQADDKYDRDLYLKSAFISNAGNPAVLFEEADSKGGVLPVIWFYDIEKNEKKTLNLITSSYAIATMNAVAEKEGNIHVFSFVKSKNKFGEVEGYYKLYVTRVDPLEKKIAAQKKINLDSTIYFLPKEEMENTKSDRWMNNDNVGFNTDVFQDAEGGFVISMEQLHYSGLTSKNQYAYDCGYLYILKVNKEQDLVWMKTLPKIQEGMDLPVIYQSYNILLKDKNVYLFYNDAKKNFEGKGKLARLQKQGQAEGVAIKIDESGSIAKSKFPEAGDYKFYPTQAFYVSENNLLFYTEKDKQLQWGKMNAK